MLKYTTLIAIALGNISWLSCSVKLGFILILPIRVHDFNKAFCTKLSLSIFTSAVSNLKYHCQIM
jgi:hypothetical protein